MNATDLNSPNTEQNVISENRARDWWARGRFYVWAVMLGGWLLDGIALGRSVNGDAISYFDIATECTKGNWGALINAYWSPAYPTLLGAWWSHVGHSMYWESILASLLDGVILVGTLACFEFFLKALFERLEIASSNETQGEPLRANELRPICYALFFWVTILIHSAADHRPDTLVIAVVLMSSGIILRIANEKGGWLAFAALGAALGFGYLCKAVMFPLAFAFLAAAFIAAGFSSRAVLRTVCGLLVFLLVSAPFALAISRAKGRFTIGDVGKIAYAEYVNHVRPFAHWQGETPGLGTPKHAERKIFNVPPVFEFATPVGGSYPPFYDQSYWYDGVRPRFQLAGQLDALHRSADNYFDLFVVKLGCLTAGFLILLFWSGRGKSFANSLIKEFVLWGPALAALVLYSIVEVQARFLAGFLILVWAGLFAGLRTPRAQSGHAVIKAVACSVVLLLSAQAAWSLAHDALRLSRFSEFPDWEVAQALRSGGIAPGDKVADFDYGDITVHYWAHLAEVKIVAEIPSDGVPAFWESSPVVQSRALNAIAQTGAKAVVAKDVPELFQGRGWNQVPHSPYFIRLLSR